MNKIAGFLFSARLMAVILAVFAVSIGLATFIENDFGSISARALVYNAHWFEILLFLGVINLTGRIITRKLYTRQKFPVFLFHLSFIVILAGAAVTRYFGSEGTLTVREGNSTNRILMDKTYIQVIADKKHEFKVSFSLFRRNKFTREIDHQGTAIRIRSLAFIPNAYETIEPAANGDPVAEIIYADSTGRRSLVIGSGEIKFAGDIRLVFDSEPADNLTVNLIPAGDSLKFSATFPVTVSDMGGDSYRTLKPDESHVFVPQQLYSFKGQVLVLNSFIPNGKITARQVPSADGQTYDAVVVEVTQGSFSREAVLLGKGGYQGIPERVVVAGKEIILSYGSLYKEVPFKLKLDNFIIERYPGSRSPSSFESQIVIYDSLHNYTASHRIYMNNILKYRGYRFYQSSYDADEKGTILSVNHDLAGTTVTYAGYFLMGLGMIASLFNRNGRFRALSANSKRLKTIRDSLAVLLLLILSGCFQVFSQEITAEKSVPVDADHAASFGRLLVQDNNGRIEPVNTLSSEVLRKLIRKSLYKGMNSDQVFLGMMVNPSAWQYEPVIRVTHPEVLEMLGSDEKYHSFASFFRNQTYILQEHVTSAFRKKPAVRTKFDNEIIKLDERVNICYMVFSGDLLRIFPVPGDSTHTWYSQEGIKNRITTEDSVFTGNILYLYTQEVLNSTKSGNWKPAEDILKAVSAYQARYSEDIIPAKRKISMEVLLNKTDIFSRISKYYGVIGFVLLVLQFAALFYTRIKLKIPVLAGMLLIIILFCIHSLGLGIRWYVSGHAPWSNGYEALTYVAWATVLAGLIFSFKSSITLSVTAILAFLTLFVAHLSWMDPQITNLVPVLKSYWLVIHVATITASYGFLAMGALLAYTNLVMMLLHRAGNRLYIKYTIHEISNTIEMSLTIGLYLLTIGVFLGAVWANESWGRYWGWDPKETWALVTVLVYAFILHMRMIPGLKGTYAFNLASLLGFSSVIMTYFGVNYYLSGLHSYAKGDPLPVPAFVYYTLAVIILTAVFAYYRKANLQLVDSETI